MAPFRLCYITDRKALPRPNQAPGGGSDVGALGARIAEAIRARIDVVQVREKDLSTRELLAVAESAVRGARGTSTRVVVNDRLDVALALGAAGVHLGQASLPPEVVHRLAPPDFLMGVSCHSLAEAGQAEAAGADYVLLGPIFETPSKMAFGPPLGLELLRAVTSRLKIPVLALGGVTAERVCACLDAGAAGIAGIRIFQDCISVVERVRELRAQFPD
ncbi:MAG: thiamine phosphate synthase [Acidobacteria bacterium]|nr:MAG: thiamine phosphate synthase [Acidobacteriota bacterium]